MTPLYKVVHYLDLCGKKHNLDRNFELRIQDIIPAYLNCHYYCNFNYYLANKSDYYIGSVLFDNLKPTYVLRLVDFFYRLGYNYVMGGKQNWTLQIIRSIQTYLDLFWLVLNHTFFFVFSCSMGHWHKWLKITRQVWISCIFRNNSRFAIRIF